MTMAQAKAKPAAAEQAAGTPVPAGVKIERFYGPGNLRPGAGKEARKLDQSIYCGRIAGVTFDYEEHPNAKDPTRKSTRFLGQFMVIPHGGEAVRTAGVYLPGSVEAMLKIAINLGRSQGQVVKFAYEIWAEPDSISGRKTATEYTYVVRDLRPTTADDPLMQLVIESGITAPNLPAIAHERHDSEAPGPDDVDPETGEILAR